MKKITFLTCIFFVLFNVTYAQKTDKKMSVDEMSEQMIQKMSKKMTLTSDQKEQLRGIFNTSFTQMKTIRQNFQQEKDNMKKAMDKNNEETQLALQKVLTPEQYKQYLSEKQHGKHMKYKDKKHKAS